MDPLESLLTKESKDSEIKVFFPTNKPENNCANINLSKEVFDKLLKKSLETFGKYEKTSEISYCKDEKVYKTINKKTVNIFKIDSTETLNFNSFIVARFEYEKITNEEFPKLEYFNDIKKENKMVFNIGFGSLNLVTQSYTDSPCSYFIELSFSPIKEDKDRFKNIINFVLENIF